MTTTGQRRRRRRRGGAWHWRQTDCWYYTPPGTKRRVRLLDEEGRPIRGTENRSVAELALARVKAAGHWRPATEPAEAEPWLVAKVCAQFIENCQQRAAKRIISAEYRDEVVRYLNELSRYCGALPVSQLRKGHIYHWLESHPNWQSPATQRYAIGIVLSAFNYAQQMHDVPNPLRGVKKPPPRPRLASFSGQEEQSMYAATDEPFGDFLFAAIHTGLRPFCELARLTADDVVETERGMMWRVYPTPLAHFAIRQVRAGRKVGSKLNVRDVSSPYCQLAKGVTLERLDRREDASGRWRQVLVEDKRSTPADIAASRLDFAAWLRSLSHKKRRVAKTLAGGETTSAAARRHRLSPGRISQIRGELREAWHAFQGETA